MGRAHFMTSPHGSLLPLEGQLCMSAYTPLYQYTTTFTFVFYWSLVTLPIGIVSVYSRGRFPQRGGFYYKNRYLNFPYILLSLKTTNKSLYVTIRIIFSFRTHPECLVPMAVMMCLNGFESVFEYDLSYNCTGTSSG